MAKGNRPPEALLALFTAIRTARGLEPFPSWPYKVALSKAEWAKNPSLGWNAFVSIVGEASYEELSSVQQIAHLGYWYEAEVYNGGHLRYFRSDAGRFVTETVAALPLLNAIPHAAVLQKAFELRLTRPELVDPYRNAGELARTHPFDDIDRAFWACKPEINELLQRYLDEHLGDFIVFKDE